MKKTDRKQGNGIVLLLIVVAVLMTVLISMPSILAFISQQQKSVEQKKEKKVDSEIKRNNEEKTSSGSGFVNKNKGNNFFSYEVANFDNLTVDNLPNLTDYRGEKEIPGLGLVIVGYNRITGWDKQKKEILWQNNDIVFGCINSVTFTETDIYIACYPQNDKAPKGTTWSRVFKVNIKDGKVSEVVVPADSDRRLTNLEIRTLGNELWGSSWQGVFRKNLNTGETKWFSPADLGYWKCRYGKILVKDSNVYVGIVNEPTCYKEAEMVRVLMYGPSDNLWKIRKDVDVNEDLMKQVPDWVRKYSMISNRDNDNNYYVLGGNNLYILSRGGFPRLVHTFNENDFEPYSSFGGSGSVYLTKDQRFLIVMNGYFGMGFGAFIKDNPIYLIDMKDFNLLNLSTRSNINEKENESTIQKTVYAIGSDRLVFEEAEGKVDLLIKGSVFEDHLSIDLATKTISVVKGK